MREYSVQRDGAGIRPFGTGFSFCAPLCFETDRSVRSPLIGYIFSLTALGVFLPVSGQKPPECAYATPRASSGALLSGALLRHTQAVPRRGYTPENTPNVLSDTNFSIIVSPNICSQFVNCDQIF